MILVINGMWRRSLLDVRTKRSADVGSDHHLSVALVKMKLKKSGTRTSTQARFNTQRLRDNRVRSAFVDDPRNRFQVLQGTVEDQEMNEVETAWKQIATIFTENSKEKVGYRKRKANKNWIQQETLDAIEERREIKRRLLQTKSLRIRERQEASYREANRKVKRLARRDKREAMDQLAAEAEDAAGRGEQGEVYKITQRVCGKFKGRRECMRTDQR